MKKFPCKSRESLTPARRRLMPLTVTIIILLFLCGFIAYKLGFLDPWLNKSTTDPILVVQKVIEKQNDEAYTLEVRLESAVIDNQEAERVRNRYIGSELADARGWSDDKLNHLVVVKAHYFAVYDHTKTFLVDGHLEQYFYLIQEEDGETWIIIDNSVPNPITE